MLPSELTIEVEQNPAESDEEYLTAQLVQYNIAQTGPSQWEALAVFLRDQRRDIKSLVRSMAIPEVITAIFSPRG
jgi:hypothetical protein